MMCLMPFCFKKMFISALVNAVPLSDTKISGNPNAENIDLRADMMLREVVYGTAYTSIHFECASMTIRNIFPWNGPV